MERSEISHDPSLARSTLLRNGGPSSGSRSADSLVVLTGSNRTCPPTEEGRQPTSLRLFTASLIAAATFGAAGSAAAQSGFVPVPPEGAEWCRNAEVSLFNRAEKRPFRCATDLSRIA